MRHYTKIEVWKKAHRMELEYACFLALCFALLPFSLKK
jgi:hypothetical protein